MHLHLFYLDDDWKYDGTHRKSMSLIKHCVLTVFPKEFIDSRTSDRISDSINKIISSCDRVRLIRKLMKEFDDQILCLDPVVLGL